MTKYIKLLNRIKEIIEQPNFSPIFHDSTSIGEKYITSNCGFCKDEFKDARGEFQCPFDMGKAVMLKESMFLGYDIGCYYRCYLFQRQFWDNQFSVSVSIERIKQLVEEKIKKHESKNEITTEKRYFDSEKDKQMFEDINKKLGRNMDNIIDIIAMSYNSMFNALHLTREEIEFFWKEFEKA